MKTSRMQSLGVAIGVGIVVSVVAMHRAEAVDTASMCIKVKPEARYLGLGYNHIVHVTDVCATAAECDVSTDVNPQPQHVTVAGGAAIEVNTFMGSPARVFVPKVICVMSASH